MSYNSDPNVQQVAALIATSPKLQAEYFSKLLEKTAEQHNAFEAFTSPPARNGTFRGVRSIFAKKKDLAVGGGRTVNFSTIGTPGGRGVRGIEELQGKESVAPMGSYDCTVDWFRDAVNLDKDTIEHLAASKSLRSTINDMLGEKMGLQKQHDMMMRLIHSASANVYRPNNRATINDLVSTDTLSLENAIAARARLTTLGAMPIMHKVSSTGSHVDGYLMFASQYGMLPIRNNDSYQTAIAQGAVRGEGNNNFSGVLVNWQGMPWYEHKIINQPWDDYIGSPMQPQAKLGVAFGVDSAVGDCKLIVNSANTKEHYFQFFSGFQYQFGGTGRAGAVAADNTQKYAWIINPDGSVGFVGWLGNSNNGNQITLNKILSKDGAGTSTLGVLTLGDLDVNTTATPDEWTGGNATLPVTSGGINWTYTDEFDEDAMIIEANAKGVPIGRSFVFGAMAACFASGRIDMNMIGQKHDYGFIDGNGYEMIFGTCVTKNAANQPVGYLRIDHALEYEGYPVPVMV